MSLYFVPYVNWSHKTEDVEETLRRIEAARADEVKVKRDGRHAGAPVAVEVI